MLKAGPNKQCKSIYLRRLLALAGILASFACSAVPPSPEISPPPKDFSDQLVRAHFQGLTEIGPRWPGDASDLAARAYLRREFEKIGVAVRSIDAEERRHMLIEIPGLSSDSLLIVTPLPALGASDWVDDSGPALILELVRLMAAEPPAYTLRFALAATEASPQRAEGEGWRGPGDPLEARRAIFEAGRSLVSELDRLAQLERVRAVVVLEPRARSNPRMARDLQSHPVFRKVFWRAADDLGESDAFPPESDWTSPQGLQAAFQDHGLGQIVALVDETTARVELQVDWMASQRERLARGESESPPIELDPVGRVTLEGLARLMERFEKVDAFSSEPVLPPVPASH